MAVFAKSFVYIYLIFCIFYFTTISDSGEARKVYRKCRASWSKWMVSETDLHWNISDINLDVTQRKCMWINIPCTRNRQCPCETYYSKELLGIELPRKRNHVCVETKSCDVLICSSVVYFGSNIDSKKLIIKTYKVGNRTNGKRNLTGIVYVPLDKSTWELYGKNGVKTKATEEVRNKSYVYLDILQTPVRPAGGRIYNLSQSDNDFDDGTELSWTFIA
ncbi:unnamed protein product [Schistosoma turkestanicum]|nr:unnamed protein product [Schistosoma turkestanicum]